jgi:hypothetical protein
LRPLGRAACLEGAILVLSIKNRLDHSLCLWLSCLPAADYNFIQTGSIFLQRSTNARRGRIADMTPLFTDGDGGVKPAMCQRPRAVFRPMLALCVSGIVNLNATIFILFAAAALFSIS